MPVAAWHADAEHIKIRAYAVEGSKVDEAQIKHWNDSPPAAAASLPVSMGGC
jgi:hypothetical protein